MMSVWTDPELRAQEEGLRRKIFERLMPMLAGMGALIMVIATPLIFGGQDRGQIFLWFGVAYSLILVGWLVRDLSLRLRFGLLLTALYVIAEVMFLSQGLTGSGRMILLAAPLLAALIMGHIGLIVAFLISVLLYVANALAFSQYLVVLPPERSIAENWWVGGLFLGAVAGVISYVLLSYQRALAELALEAQIRSLQARQSEESAREQVKQMEARVERTDRAVTVARTLSNLRSQDDLCWRAVRDMAEVFGLYQVNLWLLDPARENLKLVAAADPQGPEWVREGWQIPLGDNSVPALAVLVSRERMLLLDGHPRFPESRVELALPLVVRGAALGVLDLHGRREPFREDQLRLFRIVSEQLGVSLETARLMEEMQLRLREMRTATAQEQAGSWGRLLEEEQLPPYRFGTIPEGEVRQLAEAALSARAPRSVRLPESGYLLVVPLLTRDVSLGYLAFYREASSGDWDAGTLALIQEAGTYLAVALDNTRLVLESRRQAFYEEQLGRFGSAIWANPHSEAIMELSVRELGRLFGAGEVALYLTPERDEDGEDQGGKRA